MNITQETVDNFVVGHGGADALDRPIVAAGYARKAYKGVFVRAASANTLVIYVGNQHVTVNDGYPLPAGEEVHIPVEDPSKVYVVATLAANAQQTVALAGHMSGDTFTLTVDGQTTTPIAVTANAAAVQAALQALNTIGVGNCSVTDTGGGPPYTVEFTGTLAKRDVSLMTADGTGVNEKQNVTITNAVAGDKVTLTFGANSTSELAYDSTSAQIQTALRALPGIGTGNVNVTDGTTGWDVEFVGTKAKTDVGAISGVCGKSEKQAIGVTDGAADDKMVLTYSGQSTGELDYNDTKDNVTAALKALNNIGDSDVVVTDGDPSGWVVEFTGALARTNVGAISGVCGKNEKQTIAVTGGAAGDKMVLTYSGQSTAELNYNDTKENVAAALKALSNIGDSDVVVTNGDPSGWVAEFTGTLARTDVGLISGVCGKNEKQTIVVTGGAAGDKMVLTYSGQSTAELNYNDTKENVAAALKALSNIGDSDVVVTDGDPSGWVVEFTGALARTDVGLISGVCGKNEKQTVAIPDTVDVGTFTLTYSGQTTGSITYNATAGDVQTALENLSNIDPGDVEVTGGPGPGTDWVVEFKGNLARTDVDPMTGTSSCGRNAKQTVAIDDASNGGTFTLTYSGQTTDPINYNATAGDVEDALELLSNIGSGNVAVTGGPGPDADWVVEFKGTLGVTNVATLTGDGSSLTGGSTTVTITNTITGVKENVTITETVAGNSATVGVTETVAGHSATVGVTETVQGHSATVGVTETVAGHSATVTVTETQKGDATCTVTVAKVADITVDSQYSWLAC